MTLLQGKRGLFYAVHISVSNTCVFETHYMPIYFKHEKKQTNRVVVKHLGMEDYAQINTAIIQQQL